MRRPAVLLITATLAAMIVALFLALLLIVTRPAHGATLTVTNTNDSGAGSLRQAILDANDEVANPGHDTISFNISGGGPHTIAPISALPTITAPVTIDGYSQPGASPNTLAVGNDAVLKIELSGPDALNGLKIEADDSTVKGLVASNWENGIFLGVDATGNTVRGNFIGIDTPGPQSSNNIGVVLTNALNNTIGGTTAAARNIISDNGIGISVSGGTDNKIQGNYIGTNAAGNTNLGNNQGVVLSNAPNNIIGGTTAAARNIISGNGTWGVLISEAESTGNRVQGNYIGISAAGDTTLGNVLDGVRIQADADNNTVGGTTAAARNIISGNGSDGVEVRFDSGFDPEAATGNRILSNSIYDNDALGIDLVHSNDPPGVNINDDGDGDGGNPDANPPDPASAPNRLQNFPVITSAKLTTRRIGGHRRKVTLIKGTLNSRADKTYNVQFFGSPDGDSSGNGEGKTFLGQKSVTTDGSGDATFTFQSKKKVPNGQVVTATATDQSTGDTSEFSKACTVPGLPCPP